MEKLSKLHSKNGKHARIINIIHSPNRYWEDNVSYRASVKNVIEYNRQVTALNA